MLVGVMIQGAERKTGTGHAGVLQSGGMKKVRFVKRGSTASMGTLEDTGGGPPRKRWREDA